MGRHPSSVWRRRGRSTPRDDRRPTHARGTRLGKTLEAAEFGGPLHAFEITKAMIEAGAAGVHFEDQLSAAKKCGHLGGKVVVPTGEFIQKLVAARLASDVMGVPTVVVARTDANSARLVT